MEGGLELLVRNFNSNVKATREGFSLNDMHIVVLRIVLQDVVMGAVRKDPPHGAHVERLRDLKIVGADDEELKEEYELPSWWRMQEEGQRIDLVWYYARYNLLQDAIDLFELIADVVTGLKKETVH